MLADSLKYKIMFRSRLEAKIRFDGEVNSRLFPILMRIMVCSAFGALRAVKLITKSSLSVLSKYDSFESLRSHNFGWRAYPTPFLLLPSLTSVSIRHCSKNGFVERS